ncbi:MAG TPA: SH3 domain-containing protein [Methylomirabilota bacterium]|nr:SH3 domain-containing protein [Methylomirabilota bacterium]
MTTIARRALIGGSGKLGALIAASLLGGCAALSQLVGPAAERDHGAQDRAAQDRAARERATATEQLRRQAASNQELELQLARAHLAVLEREAQIRALQEKLDLATLEVVRAMGKLRGVESKAEAAANFAEAEIALRQLEKEAAGRGRDQEVQQARQLMSMATAEFKKSNYAGTIYLSGRVKALSASGQSRAASPGTMLRLDGETGFAFPLPLKAVSRSNVREGPALNQKIAFVVEDGGALTGYSQKDLWVRVSREDGRSGWIYYNRIGLR